MAGLRKDVELIFRGEDRASPTIKKVRDNVSGLKDAIQDQIAAAERGEGSIDELAKAYKALKDAQGDVGEIAKLAAAYENVNAKLADQAKKVEEARAKQARANAEYESAETKTKRLTAAREAAERQLNGALSKEQQLQNEVRQLGAALDAAGGDSKNFAATQDAVRLAAVETARAIRDAAAAMDQFKGKQAGGKANIAAAAELQQFNTMAAGSGLPQAQINFISTLENRMEALNAAIREDQASMAALNREFGDRAAADAAQRVRGMAAALDEADAAAARLKATQGFRQMASEIEAGARDISRFGAQADTSAVSAQRLADTIQGILNPAQAAANTIGGINSVLTQAESVTDGAKRRVSEYNAELNNLQAAAAGLANIARLTDDFRQQEAAVAGIQGEFDQARQKVLALAGAMQTAETPTEQMAADLQKAEANLEKLGGALQKEVGKLNQLEGALEKAGVDTRNLDAAQEALIASSNRLAAAQAKATAATSGTGAFMGLRPHEIQNLGFQVNDIIVSIASGQAPMRVFLQQGAQIGQIIPGAFAKIIRFAPQIAVLAAIVLTLASAFKKAADEARRMELGESLVGQMGQGVGITAQEFDKLAKSLEDAGIKADETRTKLTQLTADGLNPEQMQAYIDTAKAVAEVTGVEMTEALEQVREHFQGGMEDIIALDAETNAFTDTELDLIQALYDQGKADEARTAALSIYQGKMQAVADAQKGPWTIAVNQLGQAWNNFTSWLSNTAPIENARRNIASLGQTAAYVGALLNQVTSGKGIDLNAAAKIAAGVGSASVKVKNAPTADPNRSTSGGRRLLGEADRELRQTTATTRAQREALVVEEARNDAAQAGLSTRETALYVAKQSAIFNAGEDKKDAKRATAAGKRADAAARKREAAAKRAARAAEAEQNRIENMEEGLVRTLESLDAKVAKQSTESLETRLSAIDTEYQKLFRSIDEYSAKTAGKGMIGDRTITQARAHVEAQKTALKNYETMEFYEKRIADIEKERSEKLDTIADRVARGLISPTQGLVESKRVIDEMAAKTAEMAQAGLAFAISIRTATPDPKLEALIAKFENAIQNNSGGQNTRAYNEVFTGQVEAAESRLNQVLGQRNQLIELENMKVEMGLQTRREAQENIMSHYRQTQGVILQHINQIEAMARAYSGTLTPEMQLYFDSLRARIAGVKIEAQGVDASFNSLRTSVNQLLTTNVVGFIDSVAQSFANLASGQGDVMDFLGNIGRAFLSMIANILQTVAQLIISALILDAVDKMTGGILKPLLQVMAATATFHEGGIAGNSGGHSRTKNVNPLIFANAPRYHGGGIAGLAPNEVAAVLKKNEEVLTEDDPRHRFNGGGKAPSGGEPTMARAVLAVGDEEIANSLYGSAGEKVFFFHLKRNKTTARQILDS
jgi:hypothetical protein